MRTKHITRGLALALTVAAGMLTMAAVANAAPVIQPGATPPHSWGGTCTNCHTYATVPVPVPVPTATPAPSPTPTSVAPPTSTPAPGHAVRHDGRHDNGHHYAYGRNHARQNQRRAEHAIAEAERRARQHRNAATERDND
ncbi:MAG: hypothetical protein WC971_03440 [Coriobacteriia bacterium]